MSAMNRYSIDLLRLRAILWILVPIMILHASLSLSIYDNLMKWSYLLQFLDLLGATTMLYLFSLRPVLNRFSFSIIGYIVIMFAITIAMANDVKNMIYMGADIMFMIFLFNYCEKDKLSLLLKLITFSLSLCVYINIITLLIDTSWMVTSDKELTGYILGNNYNSMGSRIIVAFACCLLSVNYGKIWRLNLVATFICGVLAVFFVGSMTATANLLMVIIFSLVGSITLKRLGFFSLLLFYVFFQITVCFNGTGLQNNDLAVYIIVDLLGKDITFTLRTEKWDAALKLFTESPIIGFGNVDVDWFYAHLSNLAVGPHNLIFYIMVTGGIVLLGLFLFIIAYAIIRCLQESNATRTKYNLLFCLSVMLFMQTMEYYPLFFNFLLLSLIYYFPEIQKTWTPKTALS